MAEYIGGSGAQTLNGTSGDDKFVYNYNSNINVGDVVNGGAGYDTLWAGNTMDVGYSEDFDFRPIVFTSIEELDFNWMKMPMPGSATFNSSQFGSGLSNNLVVKGAWDDNDITVYLDTANFDASGWTFPTPSTTTVNGVPAGGSFYGWGPYIYQGSGIYNNKQVGITDGDTIHLIGSSADNSIVGTIVADIITGGEGNDTLKGIGGNDAIDGGNGTDTVIFTGNRSDYTVTKNGATFTVVDNRSGAPDGTDTVTNVESFQFANITLSAADVVAGAPTDTTPPAAPVISAWTDTTAPVVVNGTEPLWRISGTAEPGAVIKLYTTTLNADGSVASRTQLTTYSQGSGTSIVAGLNYVVADASGNWSFQTNLTELGDQLVSATATDAANNTSGYSLVSFNGSRNSTTTTFTNPTALTGLSVLNGYQQNTGNGDVLSFSDANVTVTDADLAKVKSFESLKFAGTATVALGANALAAGIGGLAYIDSGTGQPVYGKIITGAGNTSITDANARQLNVDASLLGAGATLTLAGAASYVVTGSAVGTSFVGAAGSDSFMAGGGNDTLTGNGGNDLIDGADGVDVAVFSGTRANYLVASNGSGGYTVTDQRGGSPDGTDTLTNVERLQFSDGTYAIAPFVGGSGNDLFNAQIGVVESFFGDTGSDTVSYAAATSRVVIDLASKNSWDGTSMDFFNSIENATGGAGSDIIYGDGGNNVLNGGAGIDYMYGGAGSDTASYAGFSAGVQVDLSNQWSWDGASMDFLNSIENATGGNGNDILVGDGGNNVLNGGTGVDTLNGGLGSDTVSYAGSTANVQVDLASQYGWDGAAMDFYNSIENATGGNGADYLWGDAGANVLEGGAGNDTLWGNGGSDTFVFRTPADGVDQIGDMTAGVDKIRLDASGFGGLSSTAGVLDASSFTVGASASAALAQIIYDSATGSLSYDADGTGLGSAAVQIATLNAGLTLSNTDFQVA